MELLSFKAIGINKLLKTMAKRQAKLDNKKPAIGRCVVQTEKWVQLNFQSQGGQVGGWKPLADSTIYNRRHGAKQSNSTKILQDVGYLRDNWKHYWDNKKGFIQSQADYGIYHDKGGKNNRPPQRRILPKHEEMVPIFKKIFTDFIRTALR